MMLLLLMMILLCLYVAFSEVILHEHYVDICGCENEGMESDCDFAFGYF
jgi:hypothetical protein